MTPTPRAARPQPDLSRVGPGEACGTGTEGRAGWGDPHPTHVVLQQPGDEVRPPSRWCRECGRLIRGEYLGVTPAGAAECGTYAEPGVYGTHHVPGKLHAAGLP